MQSQLLLLGATLLVRDPSHAQTFQYQPQAAAARNQFGEVGLLDMPSAHMAPDGQLAFTLGDIEKTQRYSIDFQALPWLETSFRYSHVTYWNGSPNYFDRSFGLKIRVLKEGDLAPDIALGIRDILGTGVYSSEYVAVSKHIGAFDITAGLGWGRLADRLAFKNPLIVLSQSFDTRVQPSFTGGVDLGAFYHGPKTGAFGGVRWQTAIPDLDVLFEYSSDRYTNEGFYGGLNVRSPVNVGLSYRPFSMLAVSAGWYYGTTYGFTVSLSGDPTTTYPSALRLGPQAPAPALRTDAQKQSALVALQNRKNPAAALSQSSRTRQDLLQAFFSETRGVRDIDIQGKSLIIDARVVRSPDEQCQSYAQIASANGGDFHTVALTDLQNPDGLVVFCRLSAHPGNNSGAVRVAASELGSNNDAIKTKIKADLAAQRMQLAGLSVGTSELWIYYENYRYNQASEAVGRVTRILMADAPPSVEIFHLVPTFLGIPQQEITITRSGMELALANNDAATTLNEVVAFHPPPLDNTALYKMAASRYPTFAWAIDPKLTERVFDPDSPLEFLVYADLAAMLQITPGLSLSTQLTGQIWSDYSFNRPADSALPHVRSDVMQYIGRGKYGISNLMLTYQTHLASNVFAEARAGYLEDMFMGVGGQLLWRPEKSRFALGADLYQVWQRDFDRLFGHQSYNVLTGHVTVYYDSPWYGINYALHMGRYLAGDYGATLEITRRFESGVEIGAWATLTNVPFSKFGEGSFDKGIIIHIPFEWGLPIWSQSAYDLHLNSLTRDGGQRLESDDSLYRLTLRNSYGEFAKHPEDLLEP